MQLIDKLTAANNVFTKIHKKYKREAKKLDKYFKDYNRLPNKINLSNSDNSKFDANRLDFISKALEFLNWHQGNYEKIVNNGQLAKWKSNENKLFDAYITTNQVGILGQICQTIHNLSGTFREQYKTYLKQLGLSWEIFERLGGLIMVRGPETVALTYQVTARFDENLKQALKLFQTEYLTLEPLMEIGVNQFVSQDRVAWAELFKYLIAKHSRQAIQAPTLTKGHFIITQALVQHLGDTEALAKLLELTNVQANRVELEALKSQASRTPGGPGRFFIQSTQLAIQQQLDLNSPLILHTWLRRFYRIGEMVTGKNLSSATTKLDDTIDWDALITLRDCIAHQGQAKALRDYLKNPDKKLLQRIVSEDLVELHTRLLKLIQQRVDTQPKYIASIVENEEQQQLIFWQELETYYQKQLTERSSTPLAQAVIPRVSEVDKATFLALLKQYQCEASICQTWLAILEGRAPIPGGREWGDLMRVFPDKRAYKEDYDICKRIANTAKNKKFKPEDPAARTMRLQQEAAQRRQARLAKRQGLANLRQLSINLCQLDKGDTGDRLVMAIEHLHTIKSLLEQHDKIQANFNFASLQAWETQLQPGFQTKFMVGLKTCPYLKDALEYNAGQFLDNLHAVKHLPEVKLLPELNEQHYEGLRSLRNWLEHGNKFFDVRSYEPGKLNHNPVTELDKVIGPAMIKLIFDLLPKLESIQQKLMATNIPAASALTH